jgi:hypothetical protein
MSAYIVSKETIDALAFYATRPGSDSLRAPTLSEGLCAAEQRELIGDHTTCSDHRRAIGRLLWSENVRSINARYPDTRDSFANMPGTDGTWTGPREYDPPLTTAPAWTLPASWIVRTCDHYHYQACEHDGYRASVACRIVDHIRETAVRQMIGDDAPWGLEPEHARQYAGAISLYDLARHK